VEQHANGYGACVRDQRKEPAEPLAQPQLVPLDELQDEGANERLRDAADTESIRGAQWSSAAAEARRAEGANVALAVRTPDANDHAGVAIGGDHLVNGARQLLGLSGREGGGGRRNC